MIPLEIRMEAHLSLPTPVAFILYNSRGYISIERERVFSWKGSLDICAAFYDLQSSRVGSRSSFGLSGK